MSKVQLKIKNTWQSKRLTTASKQGFKYVIGIDEAGRGPLAGPIAFCAFKIELDTLLKLAKRYDFIPAHHDSKKLTEKTREIWYREILKLVKENKKQFSYCVAMPKNTEIDKIGLSLVIKKALIKVLKGVKADEKNCLVLLDGGLKIDKKFTQQTIVKGDENELVIAIASIMAKVTRDHHMIKNAKLYPEYGFDIHKGYGTQKHLLAIKRCGVCPIHRRSFLKLR
jgi:ribonuclease HII